MIESNPIIGREYRVTNQIPVTCCKGILQVGQIYRVERQTSKNRLMISFENSRGGRNFHKVRRSTFRVNVEEVIYDS